MTRRILIVDDDADIRMIARVALETARAWTVIEAEGGKEAEALARHERPDLILLDYMMPDQDGPMTLGHLKAHEDTRPIPVVMLTAKVQEGLAERMRARGAAGVVAKPFDPIQLPDVLEAILGWTS